MTNWIPHPLTLKGKKITLIPLEEAHFAEICLLGQDKSIWQFPVMEVDGSTRENMLKSLRNKLVQRDAGQFYPFSVVLNGSGKIVGNTMYWALNQANRSLEIGTTWFHPDYWGTGINTECKYLMLHYCFEVLKTIRVQIKASHHNLRSRAAIEKVGFTFEGILRNDKIFDDGSFRTAAYYSMIPEEWITAKNNLEKKIP
jgi:RimJ/RimL family protein N-acetyltransferase